MRAFPRARAAIATCSYNHAVRPALLHGRVGWFHLPLDIEAMRAGAALLVGEQDFSAFRAAECQAKSPVKTLHRAEVSRQGDCIVFDFRASAFLHHMVRNMVGALVYVGKGTHPPEWIGDLLASRDRSLAAPTFSPHGLYLSGVEYEARWQLPMNGRIIAPFDPLDLLACKEPASRSAASPAPRMHAPPSISAPTPSAWFFTRPVRVVSRVEQAWEIARIVPPFVTLVGLFVNQSKLTVRRVMEAVPIQLLQFHGEEEESFCRSFHAPYIKAARVRPGLDLVKYAEFLSRRARTAARCLRRGLWRRRQVLRLVADSAASAPAGHPVGWPGCRQCGRGSAHRATLGGGRQQRGGGGQGNQGRGQDRCVHIWSKRWGSRKRPITCPTRAAISALTAASSSPRR